MITVETDGQNGSGRRAGELPQGVLEIHPVNYFRDSGQKKCMVKMYRPPELLT